MIPEKQTQKNEEEAHGVVRLRAPVVYTAIKQEGEDELERPLQSLWWSGIAAGLAIFLSVIAMGALSHYVGADSAMIHFGYSLGFLAVILGRLQLFTENTITAVIPLLAHWNKRTLFSTLRLWSIVFIANLIGVFIAAIVSVKTSMIPADVTVGIIELSKHYIDRSALEFFMQGVPAGFIVAAIVWMMPSSKNGNEFWVILIFTYLISLGGFTHVIAGSGEVFVMVLTDHISLVDAATVSILPTLAGNILGGTALFSLLAHGQVREEI